MAATFRSRFFSCCRGILRRGAPLLLLAACAHGQTPLEPAAETAEQPDGRASRLAEYFRIHKSPLDKFAAHFIEAADRYRLDWRLLPSLAMLESGGGRVYRRNNVFGWGSGRARFVSIEACIEHVAKVLSGGIAYRDKDLRAKLRTYNPANRRYADIVLRKFLDISPETPLLGASAGAGGSR